MVEVILEDKTPQQAPQHAPVKIQTPVKGELKKKTPWVKLQHIITHITQQDNHQDGNQLVTRTTTPAGHIERSDDPPTTHQHRRATMVSFHLKRARHQRDRGFIFLLDG